MTSEARPESASPQQRLPELADDGSLRQLLDHIAAELAAEYVRLMEAAAEAEGEE